jgi:hypothetical protein
MNARILSAGFVIGSMILLLFGCAGKEFRSPIVFRSPVVEKEPARTLVAAAPAPAREAAPAEQAAPASAPMPASPALVPVMSDQELANYRASVLGRVKVSGPGSEGFSEEEALRSLKVEAFKRYGSLAQGITNVTFEREGLAQGRCTEAAGDVVALAEKGKEEPAAPAFTVGAKTEGSLGKGADTNFPVDQIPVFTSEQLYNREFRVLGKVDIRERSQAGLTKEEAIKALKIAAVRAYGPKISGITSVKLVTQPRVFYYTKVRRSISTPETPDAYERAYADVIVWK